MYTKMEPELKEAIKLLKDEAKQLDHWARESLSGGWSTHQVEPMKKQAAFLRKSIAALERQVYCRRFSYYR